MTTYIFVGIFSIIKQSSAANAVVGVGDKYVPREIEPLANGCAAERTAIPPNRDVRLHWFP
ncbi:hypothetical protein [Bradyrhizobium archetypum]|uniref:Uncharacterized protein n=1 Tax=Bradyrhizobium archetypum TaxID=2721160 RepID=A0A7Y4GZL7_9BRAD|nr:hypothetical protein [Bradyrhizobium archetypum]NOJ44693.1 hypothetical protein [Bradyrhizobium archetypum]